MTAAEFAIIGILILVFICPFLNHVIERNLEDFLFVMGCLALTVTGLWSKHIIYEAFKEPIPISAAVLISGFIFKSSRRFLNAFIKHTLDVIPQSLFLFLLVVTLGLISSIITAIIASLVLVEIISILNLNRKTEINIVVIACFSIGLGAALTPIGEPLSTIAVAKLDEDFWYLFRNLWYLIIPPVLALGGLAMWFHGKKSKESLEKNPLTNETYKDLILRTFKVYLFVMALIFLGAGFKPLIDKYLVKLSIEVLFWLNTMSAILDNATLAAAEISPALSTAQIKAIIMGLLISGGMLIPGNIPNIIAAGKLKIKSSEWAKLGVPLGFVMMVIYFFIIELL